MHYLLQRLKPAERRGSKPRCHLLTHGSVDAVSERLTSLIAPWGKVTTDDRWMPRGFVHTEELQIGRVDTIVDKEKGRGLIDWWLAAPKTGRVPHWDIASTCVIEGRAGILLVEAKAHDKELFDEEAGKKKPTMESAASIANRKRIAACVKKAGAALSKSTSSNWELSITHHYEMSSRFTWACKLAELGMPVALVYLGFLNAGEMAERGLPFSKHGDWEALVKAHSRALFPDGVWGQRWMIAGQPFIPLIKTYEQPLKE
jgi:hypothetical protein